MIDSISFANYRLFKAKQNLILKPLTILIGKNSSGKSSVTKLLPLLEASLSGKNKAPIVDQHNNIELFTEFKDLVYGRKHIGSLEIGVKDKDKSINVILGADSRQKGKPFILEWKYSIGNNIQSLKGDDIKGFHGFIPNDFDDNIKNQPDFKLEVDYIGPFRVLPERTYNRSLAEQSLKVSLDGRNAYNILINDTLVLDESLIDKISEWYCNNFDGWGLRINEDKDPYLEIELTRDDKLAVNLRDVGEGMGQTLPLVTRALMPIEDEIIIAMEQPELHLHPGAHGNLAQLFAENFIPNKKHFLIETHSQNFILRMRRLVAQKKLNPDDILIYYVDFDEDLGESNLEPIEIKSNGDVTNWPEDIFNEALEETIGIINAKEV